MPRRPSDASLFVKFSRRSVLNEAKSYGAKVLDNDNKVVQEIVGAGHPVCDNIDYIHIEIPGDRGNILERPVMSCDAKLLEPNAKLHMNCRARKGLDDRPMIDECDLHRFYDEYVAFKTGQTEQHVGTDLKAWPGIDPASVEELAYFKVYTVEALAELNDSNAGRFLSLRERAREYMKVAEKAVTRSENEALKAQLVAMHEQLKELAAQQARPVVKGKEQTR